MKYLMAVLLIFVSCSTFAVTQSECDAIMKIDGIGDVEKQSLVTLCEQKKLDAITAAKAAGKTVKETLTTESISNTLAHYTGMAEMAKGFAEALGIAAEKLGMSVDKFLHTDAGMLTAAIIIWQFVGDTFMQLFTDLLLVGTLLLIGFKCTNYIKRGEDENVTVKGWFGEKVVKVYDVIPWKQLDEGGQLILFFMWIVILIAVVVTFANG